MDNRNTITLEEYLNICRDYGIYLVKDALLLSQYLHDIGVFLHFQEDKVLRKIFFLKPTWATNAVYKILDHPLLNRKNGKFNIGDADEIWIEDEFAFVRDELLKLMQKFFLTYEIENLGEYMVPERLQSEPPMYKWDDNDNLYLTYAYGFFMVKGIIAQFIVQMNRFIYNHELVWRRGVVLQRDEAFAEITEDYDKKTIKIRIYGSDKRDFMTIIADNLDRINGQYNKLEVEKLIPCNCTECKLNDTPYFFKYKSLKRRLQNGIYEVQCEYSYEAVDVMRLIDEVIDQGRQEEVKHDEKNLKTLKKREKVFLSYSHKDVVALQRIKTHLKVLEHEGVLLNVWDDTKIKTGADWKGEIANALSESKVAVLLISTDFLASDFITRYELPSLLLAAKNEGLVVLPLILAPCRYTKHPVLSSFQALNDPSMPLISLSNSEQEIILVKLADRIEEIVKEESIR